MSKQKNRDDSEILLGNYLKIRRAIGYAAILFPFALAIGSIILKPADGVQSSISCYYHSAMRDTFEGFLWVIATFLFFYKYEKKDNILTNIAGLSALVAALCPVKCTACAYHDCKITRIEEVLGMFHNISSGILFAILTYMAFCVFTLPKDKTSYTPNKRTRNTIYRICGSIMAICCVMIIVYMLRLQGKAPEIDRLNPIFYLESICLIAFGFSWLVKGEAILKDEAEI